MGTKTDSPIALSILCQAGRAQSRHNGVVRTFQTSLRALAHPLTLTAIGLLLLNDHVLKAAAPSWVTGKLSDFAGLFFFPFLLAAAASGPVEALRRGRGPGLPPRLAGLSCFGVTALWFAGMKTMPAVNEWTRTLAGWAAGRPALIVLDPTDLAALVVLWPAWRVWRAAALPSAPLRFGVHVLPRPLSFNEKRNLPHARRSAAPGRGAYAALGLATIATIATSPCLPPPRVVRVAEQDGVLYAGLDWPAGWAEYAVSDDQGRSWEGVDAVPDEVAARLAGAAAGPVVCAPDDAQTCYRLGVERVDESRDGGQTWAAAWEIPPGRRTYMVRRNTQFMSCAGPGGMDIGPYDITVYAGPEGTAVLVAMGVQGVMVGTPDGRWERYGVFGASPVPFAGANLLMIFWEVVLCLAAALLTQFGLTAVAWQRLQAQSPRARRSVVVGILLAAAGGGALALSLLGVVALPGGVGLVVMAAGALAVVAGLLIGWIGAARHVPNRWRVLGMAGVTLLAALVVGAAPVGLFFVWTAGIIAFYEVALGASALLGLATIVVSAWAIVRLGR